MIIVYHTRLLSIIQTKFKTGLPAAKLTGCGLNFSPSDVEHCMLRFCYDITSGFFFFFFFVVVVVVFFYKNLYILHVQDTVLRVP